MLLLMLLFSFTCFASTGADIKTVVACEFDSLNIECPLGERITIVDADYGRNDRSTCPSKYGGDQFCTSSSTTRGRVANNCNNKAKCTISAENKIFGDPCSGVYKYLTVRFQCIPAAPCRVEEFQCYDGTCVPENVVSDGLKHCPSGEDELGSDYRSVYACEGQTLNINCKSDEVIDIINANYGRLSSKICWDQYIENQNCKSSRALQIIKDKCNDKGSCSITSSNSIFGDPCSGTWKYTEVHYVCIKKAICTKNEFQCNHGHCIDSIKRCDGFWDCSGGEDEIGCNYLTEYACENATMKIECKRDNVIKIVGANYGRLLNHICKYQPTINCRSSISFSKVSNLCSGKRSCLISATNFEFGDPCRSTNKYLSVNYKCVASDNSNQEVNIIIEVE